MICLNIYIYPFSHKDTRNLMPPKEHCLKAVKSMVCPILNLTLLSKEKTKSL